MLTTEDRDRKREEGKAAQPFIDALTKDFSLPFFPSGGSLAIYIHCCVGANNTRNAVSTRKSLSIVKKTNEYAEKEQKSRQVEI